MDEALVYPSSKKSLLYSILFYNDLFLFVFSLVFLSFCFVLFFVGFQFPFYFFF